MIRAFAAYGPSQELKPFEYAPRELNPTELLIQVTHCGLCRTDLYMIDNAWERSTYPLVAGHEIVGIVVKKGKEATQAIGSRVGVGWIHSACNRCNECMHGAPNICQSKTAIYSSGKQGGFGTFVIADTSFTFLIPDALESKYAAPLLCAGATVYTPLIKHRVWEKSSIGIIGIGGLGHLAIQFGKALGANVAALSHSPSKEKEAIELGASNFYTFQNPPKPQSFDFLLCTVDALLDWDFLLTLLKPNGILCFVSRPPSGIFFHPKNLVSTQRVICGSNNAIPKDINDMLELASRKRILPWVEEMLMSDINLAIQKLKDNQVRYRIVLRNDTT